MQSMFVFLDIAKFTDFRLKNADVSRTEGPRHVIRLISASSLCKVLLCQVSSLQDMSDRF